MPHETEPSADLLPARTRLCHLWFHRRGYRGGLGLNWWWRKVQGRSFLGWGIWKWVERPQTPDPTWPIFLFPVVFFPTGRWPLVGQVLRTPTEVNSWLR